MNMNDTQENNNLEEMATSKKRIKVYTVILCVLSFIVGILICASKISELKSEVNQLSAELDTTQADLELYMNLDDNIQLITDGIDFSDGMDTHELYLFNKNYLNYILSSQLTTIKSNIELRTHIRDLLSTATETEDDESIKNLIQSQADVIDSEISDLKEDESEYEELKNQTWGQLEEMELKYLK